VSFLLGGIGGTLSPPLVTPNNIYYPSDRYVVLDASDVLPVTLLAVKEFLRIPVDVVDHDTLLTTLIQTAGLYFETYTGYTLINKTYRHFKNQLASVLEMTKGPLVNLVQFLYYSLEDQAFNEIDPTTYQVLNEKNYWRIAFKPFAAENYQIGYNNAPYQNVIVDFVAGFGETSEDIPIDLQTALKNHVSFLYENTGDCDDGSCKGNIALPKTTKMIYDLYRVLSVTGGKYRGI
jgi:uncharacterized phiE125 gp8 family phage protein